MVVKTTSDLGKMSKHNKRGGGGGNKSVLGEKKIEKLISGGRGLLFATPRVLENDVFCAKSASLGIKPRNFVPSHHHPCNKCDNYEKK